MSISIVAMVHELGHAVCAISQHVSVLSFGLTMYLMIPAFFVNIDDDALSLSPRVAQLQVIAAVTRIDDIIIRDSSSFISALLLSNSDSSSTESGTCIPNPQPFSQADISCCHINVTHPFPSESSLSCFITSDSSITSQSDNISPQSICLNYADVVKNKRCNTSKECEPLDSSKNEWKNKCYKPYLPNPNVKLMRLYVGDVNTIYENREQRDQHDGNQAVIWWGTSSGILEYVRIGDIIPRYWYYPVGFPYLTQSFLRQTNQISFSLAVINSLPIYNLDGNYFLCTILSWPWFWTIIPKVVTNWGYTWRKEIEKWIVRGTTFLIGIAIIRSTLSS
ncbi:hypothetical protein BKA69DRAFT_205940 [Paraphysoderma sedebokerense]|nr:hypothetical protein BKA69DRAFT_205940 [Paraphysoderma sedebokerense]